MRAGKPVIGARSGGTQELIQDGFNGFLYTVGDYQELAQKIRYLYEHPAVGKQIGENGQQWATKQFTQARYGEEIYTLLRKASEF
jgi:glycosyltransferase involved in cell wall biosynthesis